MTVNEFISTYMIGPSKIAIFEGNESFYQGTVDGLYMKNDSFVLNTTITKIYAKNDIIVMSVIVQ